jgi:ubiquitin carboxyl-terminal hydrolase 14
VKKSALHPKASEAAGSEQKTIDDEDNDWYKFDDDVVSIFPEGKLNTLQGGGSYFVFRASIAIGRLSIFGI